MVVEVLIGSDSDCHLHLDLPTVSPIHARLWIEPDDVTVYGTKSGPGVFVNFDRIDGDGKLRPGDLLWLGPPQAAGSVMLQVQFEERDTLPPVVVSPLADEEEVGVLPEDAPTPLQIALHAEESQESASGESPVPEVAVEPPPLPPLPSTEPPAVGFEDFLVMDSAGSAPPPPSSDEFLVSGFGAEWPEDAPARSMPAAEERPPVSNPQPVPPRQDPPPPQLDPPRSPAGEDVFFVDVSAEPPPAVVSEGHDAFFIDDGVADSTPVVAAAPARAPTPVADLADLSFAAAFMEEPLAKAPPLPKPKVAPPRPVVEAPPVPKPAPVPAAPAQAAAPAPPLKAPPTVSQTVASQDLPVRPPSATSAVRPLPRPDVSQSIARGDRPASPRPDRTQALRPRRAPARPLGRYAAIFALVLAALGGIGFAVSTLWRNVRLDKVEPPRARVGETVALVGSGFATSPGGNVVVFDDKPATVSTATSTRLEVVVPDVASVATDVRAAVKVRVGRAESAAVEVAVFAGPVLHGISPDVAMPGDEIVLAGSGWGLGPTVRFGGLPADVLEARETSIRVRVPAIDGGPGTSAPVVVSSGTVESNPGPFYVGRIPLLTKAEPTSVSPGDVVTLSGRGFRRERSQNMVEVGGVRALVVSAFDSEVRIVVPRVPPGSRMLEVHVPSSVAPAQVPLLVGGAGEALDFHFVAEPFDAAPGRDHAVIAGTTFGPAFVLASSGGRSSAERALEGARRLNEAAQSLKDSADLNFDLRDADSKPSLGLAGRPELIVEVTEEDAAAYAEDWTGLRGRGGAVSAGRLARWWEAVAKDLVLVLVRRTRPHFAADLAPEGRALVDLFQASQKPGGPAASKPPLRDALRLVALRVPPSVRGPATVAPVALASPTAAATPSSGAGAQGMPRLEGSWGGTESEAGRQRDVSVTFRGSTGTFAYEGVMTVSTPLLSLDQPQRGSVRFHVEVRGGLRYYAGRWDGRALAGKISADAGGSQSLGTFELRPR